MVEIKKNIKVEDRKIFQLYLKGLSYAEIAKLSGCKDVKAVDNALTRIKKKMSYLKEIKDL